LKNKYDEKLATALFYVSLIPALFFCLLHARSALLADDFYYYYVIVTNFINHSSLSFDGANLSNGFHPLWFVLVAAVYLASGHSDAISLPAIGVISALLPIIGGIKVWQILKRFVSGTVSLATAWAFSVIYACGGLQVSYSGMEVALFLALFPWLLERLISPVNDPKQVFYFTLLATAIILSRLDSAMIVGIVWLFVVGRACIERGKGPILNWLGANALPIILGGLPLLVYIVFNLAIFGALLPQSAIAKALTDAPGPYWEPLTFFKEHFGLALGLLSLVFATITFIGLASGNSRLLPWIIVVVWPIVFYAALVSRSPWPCWPWYGYPIVASSPAVGMIALETGTWNRFKAALSVFAALVVVAGVTGVQIRNLRRDQWDQSINAAALKLRDFARTHPGTYAMGDRAGAVGYVLGHPLLQLEGLVGGNRVLSAIRQKQDLLAFLKSNKIAYYISTNLKKDPNGCFAAREPAKAGSAALHMTARLCLQPVDEFSFDDDGVVMTTRVFEIGDHPKL
jgi:hypothetical protein